LKALNKNNDNNKNQKVLKIKNKMKTEEGM